MSADAPSAMATAPGLLGDQRLLGRRDVRDHAAWHLARPP
jgi:hypothetical protein